MLNKNQLKVLSYVIKNNIFPKNCDPVEAEIVYQFMFKNGIAKDISGLGTKALHDFFLLPVGKDLSHMTENQIFNSLKNSYGIDKNHGFSFWHAFWHRFLICLSILSAIATIIGFWITGWKIWHWWFFSLVP